MMHVVFSRPLSFFVIAGQVSDYTGVSVLLDSLPMAQWTLADRDYDADWFRDGLVEKGGRPCIRRRRFRGEPVKYDKLEYKRRNLIEIMFGRLKDWRRVLTCYDRYPTAFFSAVCLAATFIILAISPEFSSKVSIPNAPSRSSAGQRSQDHFLLQCRPRPSTVRPRHEPVGQIL